MFEARRWTSKVFLQILLTIMVIPYLFPLIAMVQGSLSGQGWDNYRAVFGTGVVPEYFRNSAIIAAGTIVIVYVCTMLAAFGFSKLHIRGREIYFWMMLVALTLPEVVLLTPLFATTIKLNLYNTYWAVIIPLSALQVPFTTLLARNFVEQHPRRAARGGPGRRRHRGARVLAHHPAADPADRRRHRDPDADRGLE